MSVTEQANVMLAAGLSVIPITMPKKTPTIRWSDFQKEIPVAGRIVFNDGVNDGVAVICGAVSGGLECLDIDMKYDLHADDRDLNLLARLKDAVGHGFWEEIKKYVTIQTTVTKGYHIIYRCRTEIPGNLHLAFRYTTEEERLDHPNELTKTLLETRGEGGYFAASPTPGYSVIHGDLNNVQEITPEQRKRLLDGARLLNEVWDKSVKLEKKTGPSNQEVYGGGWDVYPSDDYNERTTVHDVLVSHGWTLIKEQGKQHFYKRPGISDSIWSGSYHTEKKLFYVYTSSVAALEQCHAYTAFALTVALDYGGAWKEAGIDIAKKGYGKKKNRQELPAHPLASKNGQAVNGHPQPEQEKPSPSFSLTLEDMRAIWADTLVDKKPPEEVVLLRVKGVPVATEGNYSLIIGKKKTRKSLYITWLLSQYDGNLEKDSFIFDTEQGRHHVWNMRVRIAKLTKKEVAIFFLRGKTFMERREMIEGTLKFWPSRAKIIVIDGIRDLMSNINDPDQTNDLIHWLERMTREHNLHIILILHENKNDKNARGHLGTELANKAEMTTQLEKDPVADCTIVTCESSRGKPFDTFSFTHDGDDLPMLTEMPVHGEVMPASESNKRLEAVFEAGALRFKDATANIKDQFEVGDNKARQLLAGWVRDGKVMKSGKNRGPDTFYTLISVSGRSFNTPSHQPDPPAVDDDEVPF